MRIRKITKKILCSILVVIMCLTAAPIQGFVDLDRAWFDFNIKANAATVDGYYTYEVNAGEVTIKDVDTSISGDITIPSTLGGYPVTSIGKRAFANCSALASVTIPDSVTSIGNDAFYNCDALESVTIGNSITSIGSSAFSFCDALTSVTIPDSVTSIGDDAFKGCDALTSVTIPDSVTSIGDYAFENCDALTSVTIPDSVTSIGDYAFENCDALTSIIVDENNSNYSSDANGVLFNKNRTTLIQYPAGSNKTAYTIPDSVTSIGSDAFYNCSALTSVTIPDSVTFIGDFAFGGCSALTSVTIPDSVTSIGRWAFVGCSALTSVTIPDSVTFIGDYTFRDCDALTSVTIPDSVTSIGYEAFAGCSALTSVTIPDSVTSIGSSAFVGCETLTSIIVDENNSNYSSDANGVLFNKNRTTLIQYPAGSNKTAYTIPDSVTSIGSSAFFSCSALTSVTIPDSVISIGDAAFRDCDALTSVTIPDSVTSIGSSAFSYCSALTSVTIPDSVTSIGSSAFFSCSALTSVTIPDSVTSIGSYAFYGCDKLTDVYYSGTQEQWQKISIGSNNSNLINATIHFNSGASADAPAVNLNKSSVSLVKGDTVQLSAQTVNFSTKPGIIWSSSNKNVATVSATGKVTAKAQGTAVITATTTDGKASASCTVTVNTKSIPVTSFNIPSNSYTMYIGDNYQLYYNITPYNATNKKVIWTSSDSSVATINNSIVTAHKTGTVTVTATTEDGRFTDSIAIKVINDTSSDNVIAGSVHNVEVTFDSKWFFEDSVQYNHSISRLCSAFVTIGYKSKAIEKSALEKIGFSDIDIKKNAGRDEVNYFLASREIKVDGKKKLMIFTGYIGSDKLQWNSNFDPLATESKSKNNHYSDKRGVTHLGFDDARYYVYSKLVNYTEEKQNSLGYSDEDTIILVTGHSRGAATANLIGADLIRGATNEQGYKKLANKECIFTYTYATPNNTKSSDVNNSKFNRIFNIVNPEDFVTKVMPTDWDFTRYGTTYILPSRTNDFLNYNKYLPVVKTIFKELGNEDEYTPYPNGELTVYNIVKDFTANFDSVYEYYEPDKILTYSPFSFFQKVICPFVNGTPNEDLTTTYARIAALLGGTISNIYSRLTLFFVKNNKINDCFEDAHLPDTYYAYMCTMTEQEVVEGTKSRQKSLLYEVNCPVDVTVIEKESGEVVAQITDNIVNEEIAAKENALVTYVDGDTKSVWIHDPDLYEIIVTGNDDGKMDISVMTIDSDLGEIERTNYFDIPVTDTISMSTSTVVDDETGEEIDIIVNEYGEEIGTGFTLNGDELRALTVNAEIEGIGSVDGIGDYTSGDSVTLNAVTDENNEFIGWYENDELISTDTSLTFVIKDSVSLTAVFTDNFVELTDIEITADESSIEEIQLDLAGDNSALLDAVLYPSNATEKAVTWTSSDENVVTVNSIGIVTAIGTGSAKITLTSMNGEITDEITVNVICSHSYTEEVTTPATHLKEGVMTYTCECGDSYTEAIEKTAEHSFEVSVTAPTCTEKGFTTYTCECGYSYTADEVNANGHNHTSEVTTPATHIKEGVMTYTCACGDTYTEAIAKTTEHKHIAVVTAPTCIEKGFTTYTCECGDSYVDNITGLADHTDGDGDEFCDYCDEFLGSDEKENKCSHICHKDGFMGFIWKIINFFQMLFGMNPVCECGAAHY